jgi:hypothetical protein
MAMEELPSTGNVLVDQALERLRQRSDRKFQDLEDAMLVQAHLEQRQSPLIGQLAEGQAAHEAWLRRHELTMQEIEGKLNALIDIIDRRQRG